MPLWTLAAFWGFLVLYGGVMYAISPRALSAQSFFRGTDELGRPVATLSLSASIFISWIFAKSVTNVANLGASYGIVGCLAYAAYWLSIPVAGWVIYGIRRHAGADSMVGFLIGRYGRGAALAFTLAVLIRLYNEVWSNTAVVGGYFGDPGSPDFITAALAFTALTFAYSAKGGLRSSIVTGRDLSVLSGHGTAGGAAGTWGGPLAEQRELASEHGRRSAPGGAAAGV